MKCTCGQVMKVEADTREEGVEKMKAMMDEKGIDDHWTAFHADGTDPKPTVEQSHMLIEQMLTEGEDGGEVAQGS